jgi:hypothetical protein
MHYVPSGGLSSYDGVTHTLADPSPGPCAAPLFLLCLASGVYPASNRKFCLPY